MINAQECAILSGEFDSFARFDNPTCHQKAYGRKIRVHVTNNLRIAQNSLVVDVNGYWDAIRLTECNMRAKELSKEMNGRFYPEKKDIPDKICGFAVSGPMYA
jgi:hypothetical protein